MNPQLKKKEATLGRDSVGLVFGGWLIWDSLSIKLRNKKWILKWNLDWWTNKSSNNLCISLKNEICLKNINGRIRIRERRES